MRITHIAAIAAASGCLVALSGTAAASVAITALGTDYYTTATSFTVGDSSFTFSPTGDIFGPTAISTGGTGQVNTIFGQPTTNFTNRGTVTFGPNSQFSPFPAPTPIRFSNGDNFIGLLATIGGESFYGFAYTTNTILNSYGFERVAGQAVTATTAVPEPAAWAMMLGGFGLVGTALRMRRRHSAFA